MFPILAIASYVISLILNNNLHLYSNYIFSNGKQNHTTTMFDLFISDSLNGIIKISPFIFFSLAIIFYILFSINFLKCIPFISKNSEQIRHFVFKDAEILFKADFETLFNYIQLVLISMKAKVIEINFNEKTIEANFGSITERRIIKIKIDEHSPNRYLLFIHYSGNDFIPTRVLWYKSLKYSLTSLCLIRELSSRTRVSLRYSKIINQLINITAFDLKWEKALENFKESTVKQKNPSVQKDHPAERDEHP